jgi:hypothetical protein
MRRLVPRNAPECGAQMRVISLIEDPATTGLPLRSSSRCANQSSIVALTKSNTCGK